MSRLSYGSNTVYVQEPYDTAPPPDSADTSRDMLARRAALIMSGVDMFDVLVMSDDEVRRALGDDR